MLDDWSIPSAKSETAKPQAKPQASAPSMLDDWTSASQAAPKSAPSLLDDWAVPVTKPKSEETKVKVPAPSMLDQWSSPAPPASKTVTKPASSMLDEWTEPVANPKTGEAKAAAPSMLDQWTAPAQHTKARPSETVVRTTPESTKPKSAVEKSSFLYNPTMPTSMPNSANDTVEPGSTTDRVRDDSNKHMATKEQAKDESSDKKEEEEVKESYKMSKGLKQPPPEAFKEPDPNSLLDAFGF